MQTSLLRECDPRCAIVVRDGEILTISLTSNETHNHTQSHKAKGKSLKRLRKVNTLAVIGGTQEEKKKEILRWDLRVWSSKSIRNGPFVWIGLSDFPTLLINVQSIHSTEF